MTNIAFPCWSRASTSSSGSAPRGVSSNRTMSSDANRTPAESRQAQGRSRSRRPAVTGRPPRCGLGPRGRKRLQPAALLARLALPGRASGGLLRLEDSGEHDCEEDEDDAGHELCPETRQELCRHAFVGDLVVALVEPLGPVDEQADRDDGDADRDQEPREPGPPAGAADDQESGDDRKRDADPGVRGARPSSSSPRARRRHPRGPDMHRRRSRSR